jgi:signal transduction histidine kinase/CheY-like chemotaxis protein
MGAEPHHTSLDASAGTASLWALTLLDSTPGFALITDRDGRIVATNPGARRLLGRGPASAKTLAEFVLAAERTTAADLRRAREGFELRGYWRGHFDVPATDGMSPASYDVTLRRTPDGGMLVLATDRREAVARAQVERERAATEEYLARLGHELRTPLNAVLGFAQLLELEDLGADHREAIERILTAGRFMASLLDEVLDLARVRGGAVDLDVGPVPVLDVVQGVVDLVEPLADSRRIQRVVSPAIPAVALADRMRLWQVVLNLVSNAVKYGREDGEVRVGVTQPSPTRVRIEVADDGPGVPPHLVERMFRPFDRLGMEQSSVQGTGLGLALAHALVTTMGGTISAASQVGRGTTLTVELDAIEPGALAEMAEPAEAGLATAVVHVSGDAASHAFVAQALRSRLGASAVLVSRAAAATETVQRTRPALVLLDDELPDSTGAEVLQRLAGHPETALVPVVVLVQGAGDRRVAVRLRAAGAAAVLDLPLDLRQLLDVVTRFLNRPTPGAP